MYTGPEILRAEVVCRCCTCVYINSAVLRNGEENKAEARRGECKVGFARDEDVFARE